MQDDLKEHIIFGVRLVDDDMSGITAEEQQNKTFAITREELDMVVNAVIDILRKKVVNE